MGNVISTSAGQSSQPSAGLVTFHHVNNYGAILQAWSLVQTLERIGCPTEVIDYRPPGLEAKQKDKGLRAFIPSPWLWRMRRFVRSNLPLTPTFRTIQEIAKWVDSRRYDFLICGSDQIWLKDGYLGFDPAYYLDFGDPSVTRRVAYAPSCAYMRDYGEHADEAVRLLSRFHALSVRDMGTSRLLASLGIGNAEYVVDPTFLADFGALIKPPRMKHNYLVVVGPMDAAAGPIIDALAGRLGISVVALSRIAAAHCRKRCLTPDEWAGYVAHAQYVVTSLFHGTALALKFRKPFICLPTSTLSRRLKILDMLERFDLKDRFVEPKQGHYRCESRLLDLDYTLADGLIAEAVESSLKYLREALRA